MFVSLANISQKKTAARKAAVRSDYRRIVLRGPPPCKADADQPRREQRETALSGTGTPFSRHRNANQADSKDRHNRRFRNIVGLGEDGINSATLASSVGPSPGT